MGAFLCKASSISAAMILKVGGWAWGRCYVSREAGQGRRDRCCSETGQEGNRKWVTGGWASPAQGLQHQRSNDIEGGRAQGRGGACSVGREAGKGRHGQAGEVGDGGRVSCARHLALAQQLSSRWVCRGSWTVLIGLKECWKAGGGGIGHKAEGGGRIHQTFGDAACFSVVGHDLA